MLSIILALATLVPLAPPGPHPPSEAPADPFVRLELENGVRALNLYVEDAERQTFLSFLPLGLYHDGKHRAQFAHLLEHMLIRSTDPEVLQVEGIELNGETGGGYLRLDAYAAPDHWREALDRQRRWITADTFTAEVLEREKGRIAGELAGTVPTGYTHKWAMAAWSQVAEHGLAHAAVRGDVDAATVEQVAAYARERVRVGEGVVLVAAGPIPVAEVTAAIEQEFGALPAAPLAEKPEAAAKDMPQGDRTATWDLAARHYIEWYPVPDATPRDRLAAFALTQRLQMVLFMSKDPKLGNGKALAAFDLDHHGRRAITIGVSLAADTAPKELQEDLRQAIDGVLGASRGLPNLEGGLIQLRTQAGRLPDFATLRKQLAGRGQSSLIEAQIALTLANQELALGLTSPAQVEALATLEPRHLETLAKMHLTAKNRASVLLEPAAKKGG